MTETFLLIESNSVKENSFMAQESAELSKNVSEKTENMVKDLEYFYLD